MPPKSKITKDNVLQAAFEIVLQEGMTEVNARSIAKHLNCSTQPLFRLYPGMQALKAELYEKIYAFYRHYTHAYPISHDRLLQESVAYVEFARVYPHLFKAVYLSDAGGLRSSEDVLHAHYNRDIIQKMVEEYNLSYQESERLFLDVRFYTHGIAAYLVEGAIDMDEAEVRQRVTRTIQTFKHE